jgi:hypothetical protein
LDVVANQATYIFFNRKSACCKVNGSPSWKLLLYFQFKIILLIVSQAFGLSQNIVGGTKNHWLEQLHLRCYITEFCKPGIIYRSGIEPSIVIAQYEIKSTRSIYVNGIRRFRLLSQNRFNYLYLHTKMLFLQWRYFRNYDIRSNHFKSERIALENYLFNKYKINKPGFVDSTFFSIIQNYELLPRVKIPRN